MDKSDINMTKEKILKAANKLFALEGYHGTSVRKIAEEANVNLAAINYHFNNKENLYKELFNFDYQFLNEGINSIESTGSFNTQEFSWEIYKYFRDNQLMLLNTFKMFLTTNLDIDVSSCGQENDDFGPPGKDAFLKIITLDVGETIPFEARHWAMRMIFGEIVHFSIAMASPTFQAKAKENKFFYRRRAKTFYYLYV